MEDSSPTRPSSQDGPQVTEVSPLGSALSLTSYSPSVPLHPSLPCPPTLPTEP